METVVSTLEKCFDKPLKKLNSFQLECATAYIPKWHLMTPKERRARAVIVDKQRTLKSRILLDRLVRQQNESQKTDEYKTAKLTDWFDATLDAVGKFKLPDIPPSDAAMLLCQFDPFQENLETALVCTNDVTCPIDFKSLVSHFEAVSRTDPKHRTLLDWWRIARDGNLKYHPWIDKYIDAAKLDAPAQAPKKPAPVVAGGDAKQDSERRLALLRELGGAAKYTQMEWKFTGIKALVDKEKADGRKRCDEKTIRADLKEAAQIERDNKAAGVFTGLGQR